MSASSVLTCKDVIKSYDEGPQTVEVLKGVNLRVEPSQHIAIVGASGSGKSTLLNILGGLDKPNSGEVEVLGSAFSRLSENKRGDIRNQSMGFVYQFHHLLPEFSAIENVMMPLFIAGENKPRAQQKAMDLLREVGLENRAEHKPAELSGGERQRVAIARALANAPACVLMDEPTGNLDAKNAAAIQALMQKLSETVSTSFIVVTHDEQFAKTMDEVYELADGVLNKLS
ncbi:Lipoprotein-releasing system ATP-binding protein LolD [Thalassocella blandensis]|nr:Lipoprotein-releasing system ATP-binding protein LolD [Thalassocella blandensis]